MQMNLITDRKETLNVKKNSSNILNCIFGILLLCYQGNIPVQNKLAVIYSFV